MEALSRCSAKFASSSSSPAKPSMSSAINIINVLRAGSHQILNKAFEGIREVSGEGTVRNGIPDVDDRGEEAELSMFTVYYSEVFFIPNVRCMHVIAEAVED